MTGDGPLTPPSHDDAGLARAVRDSRSWRGVLRALGLDPGSGSATRAVRQRAEALGLDVTHFTGQRRWSDDDLARAVSTAHTWRGVQEALGLSGLGSANAVKGHAARLGIDTSHLGTGAVATTDLPPMTTDARRLPVAGAMLAAGWFALCGYDVAWPLEPCRYDLLVSRERRVLRVQVKTTRHRRHGSWVVSLDSTTGSRRCYAPDEVDAFFVVDAELDYYLIPVAVVGGRYTINLSSYDAFRLARTMTGTQPT